jgi:Flp pilus assembly protein TadD
MNSKPLPTRTCFLLILIFGLAAYSNTFASPFQLDDSINILENRSLYPLDLGRLWHYYPLRFITNLSFAFNIYLAGFATWSFHILNLLIHILTSFVVFKLTSLILTTPSMEDRVPAPQQDLFALAAALLFATHPLQTEAVTYIVQRATSLAALFYLAALWMYLKARLESARHYGSVFLLMLAAMLTKEISITLPFAILLVELCFFPVSGKETPGKKFIRWIPFAAFLLIIPLLYLTNIYLLDRGAGSIKILPTLIQGVSRWHYLLTQFRVERTYLRLLFFPVNQCFDHDYRLSPGWWDIDSWAAFSLLLSIFFLALAFFKKNRLLSFGVLWFFLTLSVESSVIPLPDFIFEHRLYLPMFGFAFFLTSFLWMVSRSVKIFTAISLAIVLVLAGMTYSRNEVWKSSFSLWKDTIKKSPHKWRAYCSLGILYASELNDLKTALLYFHKALAAGSYTSDLLTTMSAVYFRLGDSQKGTYYHQQALSLMNSEPPYWHNVLERNQAVLLKTANKKTEAIESLKKAIEINVPDHALYIQLGTLYLEAGQEDAAAVSFRKAIEVAPLSQEGYDALALLYTKKGEEQKAVDVMVEYLKYKKRHKPLFGD